LVIQKTPSTENSSGEAQEPREDTLKPEEYAMLEDYLNNLAARLESLERKQKRVEEKFAQ
jgi:hypothetical protein